MGLIDMSLILDTECHTLVDGRTHAKVCHFQGGPGV